MTRGPPSDRLLLILDLDETLIYANEAPLERQADFCVYGYHVYRRPGLAAFIEACFADFEVAVWSSASDDYVRAVVDRIFPDPARLRLVWGRSRATLRRGASGFDGYMWDPWDHQHYLKPLAKVKKLGWPLERMLIADDTPAKCVRNYGNAIYTQPWDGDEGDEELQLLSRYLAQVRGVANVRTVEKRWWREQVRSQGAGLSS